MPGGVVGWIVPMFARIGRLTETLLAAWSCEVFGCYPLGRLGIFGAQGPILARTLPDRLTLYTLGRCDADALSGVKSESPAPSI